MSYAWRLGTELYKQYYIVNFYKTKMLNRYKLLSALSYLGSIALLIFPNLVLAGEFNINADDGSTLLRLEAPENNKFDIKVEFNSIDLDKNAHINIKSEKGESRDILVSQEAMTTGVLIQSLTLGVYTLSRSTKNIDIRRVYIVNEIEDRISALESVSDESISSYTLSSSSIAVVAAAGITLGGGVLALTGRNNSSTNSNREEILNITSIVTIDPDRPSPGIPISNAPSVEILPAPMIGTTTSGSNNAVPAPSAAPVIAPAPPIIQPMTPS